ncbi:MAG: polysaccharide biosynthesis/export family protein [Acidobacteriota bacterium]
MKSLYSVLAWFSLLLPQAVLAQSDFASYPKSYKDFTGLKENLRQLTFSRMPGVSTDYKIGAGDVLEIEVVGLPSLHPTAAVSNSGTITLPILGEIHAEDLTAAELELEVAKRLKEKQLLLNPEVLVDVVDYVAKPIYIIGEVDKWGEYVMSQPWTLMDAILISGGIDDSAGQYGYLHRKIGPSGDIPDRELFSKSVAGDSRTRPVLNNLERKSRMPKVDMERPDVAPPGTEVMRVDLTPAKTGGIIQPNIVLKRGDVFIVPRRSGETFYVLGDVKKAGPVPIRSDENLLVTQAIAEAGGPNGTAKLSQGILVRHDADGKRIEHAVDFGAILRGKKPDFKVRPDDIIFIPGSTMRTLGLGLLGTIPQSVQQSVPRPPTSK